MHLPMNNDADPTIQPPPHWDKIGETVYRPDDRDKFYLTYCTRDAESNRVSGILKISQSDRDKNLFLVRWKLYRKKKVCPKKLKSDVHRYRYFTADELGSLFRVNSDACDLSYAERIGVDAGTPGKFSRTRHRALIGDPELLRPDQCLSIVVKDWMAPSVARMIQTGRTERF